MMRISSMLYELNWNKIKKSKQSAREFLKTHKSYWFSSILRSMFTIILVITIYSWFNKLVLDDRLYEYNAHTTNSLDHLFIIVIAIFGRVVMNYFIEQIVYETRHIPLRFYLYRLWRVFSTVLIGICGMILTIVLKVPVFVGVLWFIVTLSFYVTTSLTTFGSSWMYLRTLHIRQTYQKVQPHGLSDWKKLFTFYISFLGHDIINILTFGIYGIWYVPYKKATERFIFEK